MEGLLDFNQERLKSLLVEVFTQEARDYFRTQPQPDPQYTYDEVAELLGLDVATVRSYAKLEATHIRHLPVVRCTDTPRGIRIRLSEVRSWQERNSLNVAEEHKQEPEKLMSISHRRANRREQRKAA